MGEDAVEDLLAALVEVVIPQAAREGEPLSCRERRLAEGGVLLQIVREGGPEQVVLGGEQSLGKAVGSTKDRRREGVIPVHEQVLGVMALVLTVEATDEPLDATAFAGQAQLLGPHLGVGGVVERRVERVDVLREALAAARDAPGQRGRIAHHQDLTVRVGRDRG